LTEQLQNDKLNIQIEQQRERAILSSLCMHENKNTNKTSNVNDIHFKWLVHFPFINEFLDYEQSQIFKKHNHDLILIPMSVSMPYTKHNNFNRKVNGYYLSNQNNNSRIESELIDKVYSYLPHTSLVLQILVRAIKELVYKLFSIATRQSPLPCVSSVAFFIVPLIDVMTIIPKTKMEQLLRTKISYTDEEDRLVFFFSRFRECHSQIIDVLAAHELSYNELRDRNWFVMGLKPKLEP
jgi:hypothetical protein